MALLYAIGARHLRQQANQLPIVYIYLPFVSFLGLIYRWKFPLQFHLMLRGRWFDRWPFRDLVSVCSTIFSKIDLSSIPTVGNLLCRSLKVRENSADLSRCTCTTDHSKCRSKTRASPSKIATSFYVYCQSPEIYPVSSAALP